MQLKKSFRSIVAVVILVVGIVFSPFVLGQLITSDGSLETVPLIVSSIISAFLIAVGIALLVRRRMALIWVLMLSITPLFFAGVEAAMWVQFQIWSQDRNQIDLRSQEIMRKASASGTFPYLDGIALQRPYESDLYNINSSGFRTPEFSKPAPGEFRIAVLGGSTTFGLLNADKNTIPAFLEQNLRAQLARNITVWNLGVPGVTSPEELVILKHVYEAVAPDLIIAYHGGNDFGRAYSAIKGRTDRSLVLKDTIQNRIYVVLDELGTVALIRLLSSALLAPDGPDPSQADVAARIQSAVDAFDQTMAGFAAFCSVQNALCRYYLQPILTTREPRTFFEKKSSPNVDGGSLGMAGCIGHIWKRSKRDPMLIISISAMFWMMRRANNFSTSFTPQHVRTRPSPIRLRQTCCRTPRSCSKPATRQSYPRAEPPQHSRDARMNRANRSRMAITTNACQSCVKLMCTETSIASQIR